MMKNPILTGKVGDLVIPIGNKVKPGGSIDVTLEIPHMVIENGGEMIDKKVIENMMREYNVCNEGQIVRRASSVQGWLKWIFNLRNL